MQIFILLSKTSINKCHRSLEVRTISSSPVVFSRPNEEMSANEKTELRKREEPSVKGKSMVET